MFMRSGKLQIHTAAPFTPLVSVLLPRASSIQQNYDPAAHPSFPLRRAVMNPLGRMSSLTCSLEDTWCPAQPSPLHSTSSSAKQSCCLWRGDSQPQAALPVQDKMAGCCGFQVCNSSSNMTLSNWSQCHKRHKYLSPERLVCCICISLPNSAHSALKLGTVIQVSAAASAEHKDAEEKMSQHFLIQQ